MTMPTLRDLPIRTRIAVVMGRTAWTAAQVYHRLNELDVLPVSNDPQGYIAYILSSGSREESPGNGTRFRRIQRSAGSTRSEFTVNHDFPWGAEVMPLLRGSTHFLTKPKKASKARKPAEPPPPKTAWARVLKSPLGDD